jgi:hypothetical protein
MSEGRSHPLGWPVAHLSPLGVLPDWVDKLSELSKGVQDKLAKQAREDALQAFRQAKAGQYFEAVNSGYLFGFHSLSSLAVGFATNFTKVVLQTDTWDLFRLGDSYFKPTAGEVGKDVLRLINVLPILCEGGATGRTVAKGASQVRLPTGETLPAARGALSEVEHILAVAQDGTCFWVSAAEALKLTGHAQRAKGVFITLYKLLALAGVDLEVLLKFGTTFDSAAAKGVPHANDLYRVLNALKITFYEIQPRSIMASALEQAVRENPKGVLLLSFEYSGKLSQQGHTIIGYLSQGKVIFHDPQIGRTYVGLAALLVDHPTAIASYPLIFIPNATAVRGANSVIGSVVFALLPIGIGGGEAVKGVLSTPKANGTVDRGPG